MQVAPLMATDQRVNTKTPTPPASDKNPSSMATKSKDLFIWLILTASEAEIEAFI